MPIYEFRCQSCQEVFEHLAITSGEIVELKCPSCGGSDLTRVMSTCSSVVSGSASAPSAGGPQVETRSCADSGNCGTITLPGCD